MKQTVTKDDLDNDFFDWLLDHSNEKFKDIARKALVDCLADTELSYFLDLPREEQIEALKCGSLNSNLNNRNTNDLADLYLYYWSYSLLVNDPICYLDIEPIELAKLYGQYKDYNAI